MKSYLKFLSRNKLYTAIEVLGISIALAFIIPLMSYVNDLWQVNHENRDYERIYTFSLYGDYLAGCFDQPEFLKKNIPEVEQTTLFSATRPADIKVGEESYSIELLLCDLDFFDFFPTHFISGNPEVLRDITNALVSESFARRIGYGRDAVGKHFILDDIEYTIEGIVGDYERSLMLPHDVLINIAGPTLQFYWKNPQRTHQKDFCFFKVKPGTDRDELTRKIRAAAKVNYASFFDRAPSEELDKIIDDSVRLFRYDEVSGTPCNSLTQTDALLFRALLALSLVLLLFAVFNYIALNVAMGTFRSKEMATRRLLGSSRGEIILRLLRESAGMTLLCFLLGLVLSYAIVPEINNLFRLNRLGFDIRVALTGRNLLLYVMLILVVSAVAGLVPALIISRYQAVDVIKGELRTRNKLVFSKVFVFIQCFITMVLLVGSFVYTAQYRKLVHLPLGVEVDDVYYFYGPYAHHELDPALEAIRRLPCVEKAGKVYDHPGRLYEAVYLEDENSDNKLRAGSGEDGDVYISGYMLNKLIVSQEGFDCYGFHKIRDYKREGERVAWLTESMVRQMNLNPDDIHLTEEQMRRLDATTIGGIIADFRANFTDDKNAYVLVMEDYYRSRTAYWKSLAIKTTGPHGAAEKAILDCLKETLDRAWGVYKAPHIMGYVPDLNKQSLQTERASMVVIAMFSILMLVLSLLGLMGLSTWFVTLKEHDIAIRKVFGGTVASETWKNIRSYLLIVLIACLAGIPLAYWLCEELLKHFAHRITLHPFFFIAATFVIILFSAAIVTLQTLRVTSQNPSGVLKKE